MCEQTARVCYRKATHIHTQPFNDPLSGTTRVSWYQKGKTNLDFTEATDSEWHWHQLGHVQACTSLQTDNHAGTPPLSFLQAGCFSCQPTNSVEALKAYTSTDLVTQKQMVGIFNRHHLSCESNSSTVKPLRHTLADTGRCLKPTDQIKYRPLRG